MNKSILFIIVFFTINFLSAQTPEQFLPDIMNMFPNVRDMCIAPNGSEAYFTVQSYKKEYAAIVQIKKQDNNWGKPEVTMFSGKYSDIEPAMTADGLKLFFASNRPKGNGKSISDFDIWYVERKNINEIWSEPINVGAPINTAKDEFYPSIAANGNIYYTASYENSKGREDIYLAEFKNGVYNKPYSLSESINTEGWEFNAFIAPDELFIIFTSTMHENNMGGGDIYISYKDQNGNWIKAENLGISINSPKLDFCPFVDVITNTFYYSSEKTTINKAFNSKQSLDELLKAFHTYPNGMTRIYSIPFESITK